MKEPRIVIFISKVAFGAIGFGVTFLIATWLAVEHETVKELAILNGGVAYYTHDAAGEVVDAINKLYCKMHHITPEQEQEKK